MNLQLLSFLLGALLLLVGILGGGFEIKEVKMPKVGALPRVGAFIAGVLFLYVGFVGHETLLATRDTPSDAPQDLPQPFEPTEEQMRREAELQAERMRAEAERESLSVPAPGEHAPSGTTPAGEGVARSQTEEARPASPDADLAAHRLRMLRAALGPVDPDGPLRDPRVVHAIEIALQRGDRDLARQLLAEAGHPDGLELPFSISRLVQSGGRETDVEPLVRDLGAIGVHLQVLP